MNSALLWVRSPCPALTPGAVGTAGARAHLGGDGGWAIKGGIRSSGEARSRRSEPGPPSSRQPQGHSLPESTPGRCPALGCRRPGLTLPAARPLLGFPEGTFAPAGPAHVCPPPAGRWVPGSSPPCPLYPQVNDENVVKVGHRQVVNMIRQGGNHLVLKVVTVTRNLDPDDTARKKGALPAASPARGMGGGQGPSPQPPVLRRLRGVPHLLPRGVSRSPCPRVGNKSERAVRRGLGLAHREWRPQARAVFSRQGPGGSRSKLTCIGHCAGTQPGPMERKGPQGHPPSQGRSQLGDTGAEQGLQRGAGSRPEPLPGRKETGETRRDLRYFSTAVTTASFPTLGEAPSQPSQQVQGPHLPFVLEGAGGWRHWGPALTSISPVCPSSSSTSKACSDHGPHPALQVHDLGAGGAR